MKYYLAIILLSVLPSCSKRFEELPVESTVFVGILRAGEPIANLEFFYLDENTGEQKSIETNALRIDGGGTTHLLVQDNNDFYFNVDSILLTTNTEYTLTGKFQNGDIQATCKTPPAIAPEPFLSADTVTINTDLSDSPVLLLSWTALDPADYSYILRLDNLEENPTEIPLTGESGNFYVQFSGPQEAPGIALYETDFKYYGLHRLTVYAIEKSFEEVFFFDSSDGRGLLKNGPDNVDGAKGYFTGVSSFSIDLLLE